MKFLADMGISPVTTAWLNRQGHDAIHLSEATLHKLSDREIFEKAEREKRTVLTTDLDFGEIAMATASADISVIIFRQENRTPASINQYLEKVINMAGSQARGYYYCSGKPHPYSSSEIILSCHNNKRVFVL